VFAMPHDQARLPNLRGSGSGVGDELPTETDDHFAGAAHFN